MRDWILLAAAFTGQSVALVLQDEEGVWYRDARGLTPGQVAALEAVLGQGRVPPFRVEPPEEAAFDVGTVLPLLGDPPRPLGALCVCSPEPRPLPPNHREGLDRVALHIQDLLREGRRSRDLRAGSRSPSAASFVPGLVHELGSFIFGISANLDAFEARFAAREEVGPYAAAIRRSLDRMGAFTAELREYGDPPRAAWSSCDLQTLLEEVVEAHREEADRRGISLACEAPSGLPRFVADAAALRGAFERLVGFLLQHAEPGGTVSLQAGVRPQGARNALAGHLEGSSLPSADLDLTRLFEPFYFRTSGLGRLALPVARRIIESHGGSLSAGPAPGGGVRIHFLLPVAPVPRPTDG